MMAGRQVQPVLEEAGVCCRAGGFGNFSPPPSVSFFHPTSQKTHLKAPPTLHINAMSLPTKDTPFPAPLGSVESAQHSQANKSDTAEHMIKNTSHIMINKFIDFSFPWCPNNSYM